MYNDFPVTLLRNKRDSQPEWETYLVNLPGQLEQVCRNESSAESHNIPLSHANMRMLSTVLRSGQNQCSENEAANEHLVVGLEGAQNNCGVSDIPN